MPMAEKKIFIKTFGCQMNEYDSDHIWRLFYEKGYRRAVSYQDADVVVINTCAVRQKAEDKFYSELGRIKKVKEKQPDIRICVIGCLAQLYGEHLVQRYPYIDVVLGTKQLLLLPTVLEQSTISYPFINTTMIRDPLIYPFPSTLIDKRVSAFVTIMQGCNNYCSYCIVPYVRGHEWSRSPDDIIREVTLLIKHGVKEITLLGQNVNAYGKTLSPRIRFSELLCHLDSIPGIKRLRFITSHPRDLTEDLISCFGKLRSLCEHIHLPLQSGSNTILQRMHRGYTQEMYREKIALLRETVPDISISSDIIVGFPGETEYDFSQTLALIEDVKFDELFIFHYTPRPGTPASRYTDTVPYDEKIRRLTLLTAVQQKIGFEKNSRLVGRIMPVLFDMNAKRGSNMIAGRLRTGKVVNCHAPPRVLGKIHNVLIERATAHSLIGRIVNGEDGW